MMKFIYHHSTFKVLQSRLFSTNPKSLARLTRDQLRERLRKGNSNGALKGEQDFHQVRADSIPVRPTKDLWKCLGFTAVIGSSAFVAAAVVEYERSRRKIKDIFSDLGYSTLFNNERQFQRLTEGQKVALGIIAANTLVFLLWRIPAVERFMWQYFSNSFASKSLCSPMLLSVFSHYSMIHLGLNMYVLYNFVPVSINKFLGPEQFLAFYLTAGTVSSLTSLTHKALVKSPIRALGASGAILAALCYVCMKMPSAKLSIIFLPMFSFSAENAVYGIIVFDLVGLLFGFRMFDHAAHIGGSLFGLLYAWYGEKYVNEVIYPAVIRLYRKARGLTGPKPPPPKF